MRGWRPVAWATAGLLLSALVAAQEQPPPETVPPPKPEAPAVSETPATPASEAPSAKSSETETSAAAAKPSYSRKGADTCIACHDDAHVLAIFRTPHARRADSRTPFGHGQLQCEACHGPGGAHAGRVRSGQERPVIPIFGSTSPAPVEQQNGVCLDCHGQDVQHGWAGSAHEREGVACTSCHKLHAAHDPVLDEVTQAENCMGCHPQQRAQSLLPFTHPVRQERMACSDCHDPHGTLADFALVGRTLNDTCFTCHAEKRGPYLWEHAPATEDCSLCHQPHGSNHPALLTQRPPLLCQQCHSEAGHPSVPLAPGQLPQGVPSAQALGRGCANCHSQVHGSNHPSGAALMR